MEDADLLRNTLGELRRAVETRDTFALIMAAGHIRKCLLDGGNSLALRVNRTKRLSLRFLVPLPTPLEELQRELGPTWQCRLDGFSARLRDQGPDGYTYVNLDRFLGWPAAVIEGRDISVRELVLHVANVAGGIHRGAPTNEVAELLEEMSNEFKIGAMDAGMTTACIRGIADVVVSALEPLTE